MSTCRPVDHVFSSNLIFQKIVLKLSIFLRVSVWGILKLFQSYIVQSRILYTTNSYTYVWFIIFLKTPPICHKRVFSLYVNFLFLNTYIIALLQVPSPWLNWAPSSLAPVANTSTFSKAVTLRSPFFSTTPRRSCWFRRASAFWRSPAQSTFWCPFMETDVGHRRKSRSSWEPCLWYVWISVFLLSCFFFFLSYAMFRDLFLNRIFYMFKWEWFKFAFGSLYVHSTIGMHRSALRFCIQSSPALFTVYLFF